MHTQYGVILADAPWAYRTWSKKGAGRYAESHYPTMRLEAIKALAIDRPAAPARALFSWITFTMLRDGRRVMAAGGFAFQTVAFGWLQLHLNSRGF